MLHTVEMEHRRTRPAPAIPDQVFDEHPVTAVLGLDPPRPAHVKEIKRLIEGLGDQGVRYPR
ncbi:hypothetical protein D3C71_1745190 [compost metagenome]